MFFGGNYNNSKNKKAKQVPIYKKKEKRVFIAVLSIDLSGKVLFIQNIWK